MELELSGAEPSRAFEIVNCGGSSYASYRLIPILQEVLEYEPDLIILMTGHNEFLEDRTYGSLKRRSRARAWIEDQLYSLHLVTLARRGIDTLRGPSPRSSPHRGQKTILESEVNARLNYGSGYASYERDEAWWQGVMEHFRHSLHLAVKMCSEAEVPLVLVNPGANLRDCPPFKSEHRSDLTPEQLAEWTAAFEEASRVDSEDPARALAIYARARTLDGEYAQLIYRVARCLDRLGRYEEAHKAYVQAKDLDVCPLRILEPLRDILFEVAQQTHTPIVDARGLLEKRSPQGIAGFNCYVDHVHPSIRGHQLIARSLAEKIGALSLLGDSAEWDRRQRRKAYQHHLQALGDLYLAQGRARIEFLEHWARRDRFRRDTAALDARGHLDLARSHFEFGERSEAQAAYRRALELDPASVSRLLDHALELFQEGCPQSAEVVLQLARENSSTVQVSTLAELALAILKLEEGQLDAPLALYKKVRLPPSKGNNGISPWLIEVPDAFKRLASMK